MPSDQDLQQQAEEWKNKGNEAFKKSELEDAIQAYSTGLVQVDRLAVPDSALLLKATLLSNRAACYLKQAKFSGCVDDCSLGLKLIEKEDVAALRGKLLFRRAKARFMQVNFPGGDQTYDVDEALQTAAKDLLTLLSFDSQNKEGTKLLQTIRAQHAARTKDLSNTPMAKTINAIKKHDDKMLHHVKVLMGMLTNDTISAPMELGRLQGVKLLLDCTSNKSLEVKVRALSLQALACAASHPPFCRAFLVDIQDDLLNIVLTTTEPENDDIVVSALSVYLRLILHLDRDDPLAEITGTTKLKYDPLLKILLECFKRSIKVIRAALDLLSTWTAGYDRESIIRASLDNFVDLPPPKTLAETRAMTPKELSDYRHRKYQTRTRDEAWAFERSTMFCQQGGLDLALKVAVDCDDLTLRREITVTLGKVLAALDEDERIKNTVKDKFGYKEKKEEKKEDDKKDLGVVIEEITDEDDEEEVGKVTDVTDDKDVESDVKEPPATFEMILERAALACCLLLAKPEVGAWAMGSGWPTCKDDLNTMISSNQKNALCLVAEVMSSASSVKETRPIVGVLLGNESFKQLLTIDDKDIRTAAASAVAKLGLAEQETDEVELIGLLEAALFMLEDKGDEAESKSKEKLAAAKLPKSKTTATTSVERGVEVLTYLASKTQIKEELAHGFQASPDSEFTGLELLVKVADMPDAGESISAYGLATIFQLLAVTSLTLRKESFEGKEMTMEQYDQIQQMNKTEDEKEVDNTDITEGDTDEQCSERIRKMTNANVPRALVQLTEGASEKTLEQLITALMRMASEVSIRGTMIQQGVLSALIKLDKEEKTPSDTKKKILLKSRHCIGKLLVTMNPSLLTAAQRMGSIKPLILLVRDTQATDLQRFEALMALTNIAASGDDAKTKIVSEKGISSLNFAMFSDHDMVKRAATEAMCNLIPNEAMMKHLKEYDTLRLWLAFASDLEENYECARAAAGGLAMATQDPEISKVLITIPTLKERIDSILEAGRLELMHRIFVVLLNLAELGGECKEALMNNGFYAFSIAYVESYHDGTAAAELEFGEKDKGLFDVTVDLAKQIVRACEA